MYSLISKWFIKANQDAVLRALRDLAAQVEAHESDTWMYLVHTGNQDGSAPPPAPGEVVFVEAYKDLNGLLHHVNGPLFQAFLKQYGADFVPVLAPNTGPLMEVESLARIAGFVRPQGAGTEVAGTAKASGH
jgi:quinol monooxygenase YgiN